MTATEDNFTDAQRKRIDAAWRAWQWEENRDRGYNFQLCQRLRADYYRAIDEATEENKEKEHA